MNKQTYYVTMETGQVHLEPFDDQVKYYEVLADKEEIHEIERLFEELHHSEYGPDPYLEPLREKSTQKERNKQQLIIDKIFTSIYELGTNPTKDEIRTMNGLNQRI
ncbi:hypothetical protein [Sutcliffiella rhizosphaerae]|uniref:Hydrolase n=1 Tax=Sutcliffiella rhizosphaerae TaxID=2880967 RepID=A0ABN8AFP2_9BACI|nr:hypothetical protein [Sutcliffiella rhizosphaerae]CAG9622937.1 hypothetical protein BACCIP111883_03732 [Sutcliffiella rhizosphaerae]